MSSGGHKILIVEDDFDNQKFLKMFLKRRFEVGVCDSEKSFYEQLENNDYDIILMDISLKGNKDGLQLTKEIKNNPAYKNIPVVCLSAHAYKKDQDNAYEAGVDMFLTKPIENDLLVETINSFLNKND